MGAGFYLVFILIVYIVLGRWWGILKHVFNVYCWFLLAPVYHFISVSFSVN